MGGVGDTRRGERGREKKRTRDRKVKMTTGEVYFISL